MVEWVCFGNGGGVKMNKDFINEIKKCLTDEIESVNTYATQNRIKLKNANIEELIVDKIIGVQSNLVQTSLIAEEFNQIHAPTDLIEVIAIELNNNHRKLIISQGNLDNEIIECIALQIRCYIQYFRILERFRRKDKGDLQNLQAYINSLKKMEKYAISPTLKAEVKKEISFLSEIDTKFKNSKGDLCDFLSIKKPLLLREKINKLEHFIKSNCLSLVASTQ